MPWPLLSCCQEQPPLATSCPAATSSHTCSHTQTRSLLLGHTHTHHLPPTPMPSPASQHHPRLHTFCLSPTLTLHPHACLAPTPEPSTTHYLLHCCSHVHAGNFTVDALDYGNVGRYINHSCQPNLFVQPAVVGHTDPDHPLICFFAGVNIPAGSQLTYDYGRQYVEVNLEGQCRCGSRLCISKELARERAAVAE